MIFLTGNFIMLCEKSIFLHLDEYDMNRRAETRPREICFHSRLYLPSIQASFIFLSSLSSLPYLSILKHQLYKI